MGILNLTPDSFYDGGNCIELADAVSRARKLREEGAHILDLGAESTRPGARTISPEEEIRRLSPALERIRGNLPHLAISIDTRNAKTAAYALEKGAKIINDVSGCAHDEGLIDILASYKPAYVLTHAQGSPETMQRKPTYKNLVQEVLHFFEDRLSWLCRRGLPEDRILLDPGIGFGKTPEHNLELLRNVGHFMRFERPVLGAISMKSLFGELLGHTVDQRALDSAVASALLWKKGVFWHRVHRVRETADAIRLASAI